ncbi:MAG: hypothetical protein HW378_4407, partial [Anaerolineales bacterium]|nr:hypothetical protein [Anaerolineales bacterium]
MKHLGSRTRWARVLCVVFALALTGGAVIGQSSTTRSPSSTPHSSECTRFLPLPVTQPDSAHDPPTPDLPPPPPRRDVPFREPVARLTAEMGFDTVVQVFPWRDFNPARGQYVWQAGDDMVRVAHRYGLDLVIRLDMPPEWAMRPDDEGLPFDLAAYADFVSAVAEHY